MRKCKLAILYLLIFATLTATFVSCGKTDDGTIGKKAKDFDKIYQSNVTMPFETGYLSAKDVDLSNVISTAYGFVLYHDTTAKEYRIYSLEADQTVLQIGEARIQKSSDITLCEGFIKVVETATDDEKKTTTVYGANGTSLATAEGEIAVSVSEDGFLLQESFYYVKDGELKKVYTIPPFTQITSDYTFTDQYIVYVHNNTAVYYNEKFEVVARYEVPGHCANYRIKLLDNDSLFVQYAVLCDSNSKNYDYIKDQKYTLHSLIFEPGKEREKELDLGVYAIDVFNPKKESTFNEIKFNDLFTDEVENILSYYAIVDGVIDQRTVHYVLLESNGKVGASLDQYVKNQKSLILPLNNGYYYTVTTEGYAILDGKGEVVRNTAGLGRATEYGYISENKIYNTQFELVLDLSNAMYSIIDTSGDVAAFYSKKIANQTRYFRYDKNGEAEITLPNERTFDSYSPITVRDNYYVVKTYNKDNYTGLQFDVYTLYGQLLFSTNKYTSGYEAFNILTEADNALLVSYTDSTNSKTVYKRLAK